MLPLILCISSCNYVTAAYNKQNITNENIN